MNSNDVQCPVCGCACGRGRGSSANADHPEQTHSELVHIIYKHLRIKVKDKDKENICEQCKGIVIAWDEFAEKCWSAQIVLNDCAASEVKLENDSLTEIKVESVYDTYENKYSTDEYDTKSDDPLSELSLKIRNTKKSRKRQSTGGKANDVEPLSIEFICHVCFVNLDDWITLREHCSNEHSTKPNILCTCGKYLTTEWIFKKHQSVHGHSAAASVGIKNEEVADAPEKKPKAESKRSAKRKYEEIEYGVKYSDYEWKCHLCSFEGSNWSRLKRHCVDEHSTLPKILCICGKFISSDRGLQRHHIAHSSEDSFKYYDENLHSRTIRLLLAEPLMDRLSLCRCEHCGKKFLSSTSIKSHYETAHMPKEEYKHYCKQCPKKFANAGTLKLHVQYRHTKPKFPCDICGLLLTNKSNVAMHKIARHGRVREHVCDICGKAFKFKGTLKTHRLTHNEEREFKCEKCGKAFRTEATLKSHLATHSEATIKCPKCPAVFSVRRNLKMHLVSHSGVFNYTCKYCGKEFKRKKGLRVHIDSHEGVRRYKCEWCPKMFTCNTNLKLHKSKVHSLECTMGMSEVFKKDTVALLEIEKSLSRDSLASSTEI